MPQRAPGRPGTVQILSWLLLLLLALALFSNLARYHWLQTGDDAFIAFRYALHLAEGAGPVWNLGEPPVEGYSSPLWLFLLAGGALAGLPLPTWAGGLGLAFSAATLGGVWLLARRTGASNTLAGVACVLASLLHGFYYWSSAGLETSMYAALLVFTCAAMLGGEWPYLLAFLGLARPEGPALVLLGLLLVRLSRGAGSLTLAGLLTATLPTLAWLIFRLLYYGSLLPNTYFAKATGAQPWQLLDGLHYSLWALLLLLVLCLGLLAGKILHRSAPSLAMLGAVLAVIAWGGGDWMWHHRLLQPVLSGLVALLPLLWLSPGPRRLLLLPALALLLPCLVPVTVLEQALRGQRLPPESHQEGTLVPASVQVAQWIGSRLPRGSLVAVDHAGALGFYLARYSILDMTGLNDLHIAHQVAGGIHGKYDAAYVLARKPAAIVLNSRTAPGTGGRWFHQDYWEGETALVREPGFQAHYSPVPLYWKRSAHGGAPAYILVYLENGLDPKAPAVHWTDSPGNGHGEGLPPSSPAGNREAQ